MTKNRGGSSEKESKNRGGSRDKETKNRVGCRDKGTKNSGGSKEDSKIILIIHEIFPILGKYRKSRK